MLHTNLPFFAFLIANSFCAPFTVFSQVAQESDSSFFQYADKSVAINEINISGNKKTKMHVIFRELVFKKGEEILQSELLLKMEESRRNLVNTGLFLDVSLKIENLQNGRADILVTLKERWYIFPVPYVELADRNFNDWWETHNHDFGRLEYGISTSWDNLTGNYDELYLVTQYGFTPKFEVFYERPYFSPNSDHGIGAFVSIILNKNIPYNTFDNEHLFYEHPKFVRKRFRAGIQHLKRQGIYGFHTTELKYNLNTIGDTIAHLNPDYFLDGKTKQQFLTGTYTYTHSNVDNRSYPLKGNFWEASISKRGLPGVSDVDQVSISARYNQYFDFGKNFYFGAQVLGKMAFGKNHPYFNERGLGYCQDIVRGYELFVIDGQHFLVYKTNLKKKLFDFVIKNPIIKSEMFAKIPIAVYLKSHVDFGYVWDNQYFEQNPLTNKFLVGGGVGLDIVTFYDWIFRIEYSVTDRSYKSVFFHLVLDLNTYEDCSLW